MTDRLPETENWVRMSGVSRRAALGGGAAAFGYALAAQPVSAAATRTPAEGLEEGMIRFPAAGGFQMNAYRAKPKGVKNPPVILVVQEIFGLHEWIRDVTRRFAALGYYAIAPDMYQRQGDPTTAPDVQTLVKTIVSQVPDAQVMADLDAAAAFAGKDGGDAKRLGVTGFCWGGRITWLYAAHNPGLKAGVAWYGRLLGQPNELQPKHPIDVVADLKAPVLGLYGELDKGIPLADVEKMNAALKAAGSKSHIRVFPGADHGFLADYRPSFHEASAKAAWADATQWFKRFL
ncbi:dienelactone hydrolase family protein [Sandaracinobacter sp. RS1-74]|uniref:dienelactone hydrolase family protein n=1 Tax=Sandaracinobacteroides sayramensis TaxID=2913411 RepID=UPI001EDA4F35|nr:dienelactone hydrolase family protein [Sandaracinobacteroides sayramensis]MCG2841939.1 dienelactone hydrolase family protein [Sandaracinobacteroides sayramensis]